MTKESIKQLLLANRGAITLFAITFIMTMLAAALCAACGASRVSTIFMAQSVGALSLLTVNALFGICSMPLPFSRDWGLLGVVIGTILATAIF